MEQGVAVTNDLSPPNPPPSQPHVTRRRVLGLGVLGVGVVAGAGAGLFELVDHSVLPGHQVLVNLLGRCDVTVPPSTYAPLGPSESGTFFSQARHQTVGYTIAYPPGHGPGDVLPLVIALHGFGANHTNALAGISLGQALALEVGGRPLSPMAMVAVDGGGGYWHAHPHDDSLGMLTHELLPLCQSKGLGVAPEKVGVIGVSMGGYGALNLAEHEPHLIAAVAAVSPAVWTSYAEAHGANPGAFGSAEEFAANDVIAHVDSLRGIPVRISSGLDDPFHPGVEALVRVVPSGTEVDIRKGCHDGKFFGSAQPAAIAFLNRHLT